MSTIARGILAQLNRSPGGMPKRAIDAARITFDGVAEDWQKNRKYHGGRDRAICLFSEELYAWLRDDHAIDLANGSVGENFTTRGIDLVALEPGDRLNVGESCVIELVEIRVPCRSLDQWDAKLKKIVLGKSGWVARVIVEGDVRRDDPIIVARAVRPCPGEHHGRAARATENAR